MTRRVAILGGTFDPMHRGHVDIGRAVAAALDIPTLWVIPSHVPPHRQRACASPFHRFAMASLAVSGRPGWKALDLELRLAEEPSYSISTLRRFHARGYAPSDLYFVMGADAFADIRGWKESDAVLASANFAVVSRPGFSVNRLRSSMPELAGRMCGPEPTEAPGHDATELRIHLIDSPTARVSSTEIRRLCAEGQPITGLVEPSVEEHIAKHGLYAPGTTGRRRNDPQPHRNGSDVA